MSQALIDGDLRVTGRVMCGSLTAPANSVTNASIAADAGIEATKFVHQWVHPYRQAPGSAVVADTYDFHIATASGLIVSIEAVVNGAIATGADRDVTIDLLKSTGGGAFASVMSAPIVLDDASVLRTLETGAINNGAYIDGDILRLTIAVAGAAGAQAQGILVSVKLRESP